MKLTKQYILDRVNKMLISFKVEWEDLVHELDMGIEEINKYMSTSYPLVSDKIKDLSYGEPSYTDRVGGKDVPVFPIKYFFSIVIPYAVSQLLAFDEEFGDSYIKYSNQYSENLFVMARDELNNIPQKYVARPQGVYFANPHPAFKRSPEHYFNRRIKLDEPKLKLSYSWGNYNKLLPPNVEAFVSYPLPVDHRNYEPGDQANVLLLGSNEFNTYLVDHKKQVLGVFLGWSYYPDNDPEKIIDNTKVIFGEEDIQLFGVFDLDVIGIIFNGNGGTLHNWKPVYLPSIISNENQHLFPYGGTASRKGYEFSGFDPAYIDVERLNINSEDPDSFGLEQEVFPEEDIVLTALWTAKVYSINYHNVVDEYGLPNSYKFGVGISQEQLVAPKMDPLDPHTFIGYWDNPSFLGEPILYIPESWDRDLNLYAKYSGEKVTVTFHNLETGKAIFSMDIVKGARLKLTEDIKDLYEYKVYEKNEEGLYWQYSFTHLSYEHNPRIIYNESDRIFEDTILFINYNQKNPVMKDIKVLVMEELEVDISVQMGTTIKSDNVDYLLNLNGIIDNYGILSNTGKHYSKSILKDNGTIVNEINVGVLNSSFLIVMEYEADLIKANIHERTPNLDPVNIYVANEFLNWTEEDMTGTILSEIINEYELQSGEFYDNEFILFLEELDWTNTEEIEILNKIEENLITKSNPQEIYVPVFENKIKKMYIIPEEDIEDIVIPGTYETNFELIHDYTFELDGGGSGITDEEGYYGNVLPEIEDINLIANYSYNDINEIQIEVYFKNYKITEYTKNLDSPLTIYDEHFEQYIGEHFPTNDKILTDYSLKLKGTLIAEYTLELELHNPIVPVLSRKELLKNSIDGKVRFDLNVVENFKQQFHVRKNFIIDKELPIPIVNMKDETPQDIISAINYIENKLYNGFPLIGLPYKYENKSVLVLTRNQFLNKPESQFLKLKDEEFDIYRIMPSASITITEVTVDLDFKIEVNQINKVIYISNRYITNGNQIGNLDNDKEIQRLYSSVYTKTYKEALGDLADTYDILSDLYDPEDIGNEKVNNNRIVFLKEK